MTRGSTPTVPAVGPDTVTAPPAGAMVAVRRGSVMLAVVILVLTQLMFVVDTSIVNVALPDIGRELGFSSAGLSWVVTAYALTFGGLVLLSGKAGSIIGPRRALILGVTVFVIGSIAGGLATSAEFLVAARALQGVGAAVAAPSVMVLLMGITVPGPQRSRAAASAWPFSPASWPTPAAWITGWERHCWPLRPSRWPAWSSTDSGRAASPPLTPPTYDHPHRPQESVMTEQDPRFSATFWDQRYSSTGQVWSGEPNPALVEEVSFLPPGTALEVGCGEGADAIWLAGHGWQVTGTDFSLQALQRAAGHTPAHLAGHVDWQQADIRDWQPGEGPLYDLVAASFNHFPQPVRRSVFAALAGRVAPEGHLMIVGHHPSDLDTAMPRPPEPGLFYTADDLAADLPEREWKILTRAARPRAATTPDGTPVTIHDTVFTAQRTR